MKINTILIDLILNEEDHKSGVEVLNKEQFDALNKEVLNLPLTFEQVLTLITPGNQKDKGTVVFNLKTKRFGKKEWFETIVENATVFLNE